MKACQTRRNRGSAALEASLVLTPLFMMLFALIDFSMAVLMKNTVQTACREGVRYAITGQTMSGMGQDASIKSIVQSNSLGFLAGTSGAASISITYYNPTTLSQVSGVNSNAAGNIVVVAVNNLSWAWIAPFGRSATPLIYSASSADVVEPSASGVPPAR